MSGWTAVLLAGSRPTGDPLAKAMNASHKALIPVAGEPMLLRPLRALLGSPAIREVIVLTQDPDAIRLAVPKDDRVSVRPSRGTIAETIEELVLDKGVAFPILVTTADHALLSGAMIGEFLEEAEGADLALGLVERKRLLKRFPEAKRTWVHLRGGSYSGANLFALGSKRVLAAIELWRGAEQGRKKGWRILSILGPSLLIGGALRLLTVHQIIGTLGRRLHMDARAVEMSDPLAAVDVDKPEDHALVESIIAGRA